MIGKQKIACIIPARLASTRFPKKMLAQLCGKPLLEWVWEAASSVKAFDEVLIAVDAEETADLIASFGGKFAMTSVDCPKGTDRLCELQQKKVVTADIFVNWQGDEPFITKEMIASLLSSIEDQTCDLWTLKKKITNSEEIDQTSIVKVVCDHKDRALYFSRATIPFYRDAKPADRVYYKHIGIYAYRSSALEKISSLELCDIEEAESLEQLRFLYNGMTMRVHTTDREVLGIDLPEHLAKAEALLQSKGLA